MNNDLLIAVLAGFAGMFGWGFADFFAKKTIEQVGDLTSLVWAHIAGFLMMVVLLAVRHTFTDQQSGYPTDMKQFTYLAFFGVLQAFVYFMVYKAFSRGRLAIINPIFSSYSALTVLLSVIIFGEILKLSQLVILGLVFVSILVISLDTSRSNKKKIVFLREPGFNFAIVGSVAAAVWTVLWGHFVVNKDWLMFATLMYGFMTLALVSLSFQQNNNIFVANKKLWKYFGFIGLAEVIAYVGISYGYSETSNLSVIAVLSAAFSIPTIILARVFLGEKITNLQKIGVGLAIAGVSILPLL